MTSTFLRPVLRMGASTVVAIATLGTLAPSAHAAKPAAKPAAKQAAKAGVAECAQLAGTTTSAAVAAATGHNDLVVVGPNGQLSGPLADIAKSLADGAGSPSFVTGTVI